MGADDLVDSNRAQVVSETDDFTPHRYAQMAAHISTASRVLDVGCNTGRGGRVLRDLLPEVELVGVEMVGDRAARIPDGVYGRVYTTALEELPDSERFDAVVMGELIEHVPYGALDGFIAAAYRTLLPGGRLVLTTPNPHYIMLRRRSGGSVLGGPHVSVHCATALCQLLTHHRFTVDSVEGTGRVSLRIGRRWPLLLYGSYLLTARRP